MTAGRVLRLRYSAQWMPEFAGFSDSSRCPDGLDGLERPFPGARILFVTFDADTYITVVWVSHDLLVPE